MNISLKEQTPALKLIEVGLTLAGIVAVITPLLLWASWSKMVFYTVLSTGMGAFVVFISLAHVRGMLLGDSGPGNDLLGLKAVSKRMEDWDRLQEEDVDVGRRQKSIKGDARREVGFMFRVTFGLIAVVAVLFFAVYWMFELRYGA
jgi:hypothetical protein